MLGRLLNSPIFYFVGAAALALLALATQFELRVPSRSKGTIEDVRSLPAIPGKEGKLNVVFVLVDTLRSDRLSGYGYERPTSPILDDLGRYGVVFKRVVSQSSWTKTSMASLWTGAYPGTHGILRFNHVLPAEAVLPAERFLEAGYRTAGIWRNGWVAPNFGFDQGFEVYVRPTPGHSKLQAAPNPSASALQGSDEDLLRSATAFFEAYGREPFFLYVHMMDLHQYVFDKGAEDFGPSYSDAYDKSINWSDRVIGALAGELDRLDLLDRTLIAISSDHGEAFREHGQEGHAKNLYGEVTHVPFIISLPFRLDPGVVVEDTIANVDIWPTLLDLAGLPPLPEADGVSQVPLILSGGGLEEDTEGNRRPVFAHLDRHWGHPRRKSTPIVSVTVDEERMLFHSGSEKTELYDLSVDPGEKKNLLEKQPEKAEEMRSLITSYLESEAASWGDEPPLVELDDLQLNQLRALGYRVGTPQIP